MVICDNIDKLFTYNPKGYCVLRDFTRSMRDPIGKDITAVQLGLKKDN